jgi:hypothetical protein
MFLSLQERRTVKAIINVGTSLERKEKRIGEALGRDVDLAGMFSKEIEGVVEAAISALSLLPCEWNEDLLYDVIAEREPFETFSKFAARSEEELTQYAFNSRDGYYVLKDNPGHADFAMMFGMEESADE